MSMRRPRNSPKRLPLSTTPCNYKAKENKGFSLHRRIPALLAKHRWSLIAIIVPSVILGSSLSSSSRPPRVHPRYIRHIISEDDGVSVTRFGPDFELYPSKRPVYMSRMAQARQKYINDHSDSYEYGFADEWETKECPRQHEWQVGSFPVCNTLHESNILEIREDVQQRMLGHGYWRDVWVLKDGTFEPLVVKTMRYEHDYEERNYDRHRRDALAMERLTPSTMIVNIYGFCGNSGVFEFASDGSLSDAIWSKANDNDDAAPLDELGRLRLATQAAMGVAAVHNFDKEGVASVAHTDITPSQFVGKGGLYKLNDFNRARFLRWNVTSKEPCSYLVGRNPGKNRSPEEYSHEPQTEKVDVYSLGNILYMLLTGLWPFEDVEEKDAQKQVKKGLRPAFPVEIWNSTSPILMDLKEAMFQCHEQDIKNRATAREVETMLLRSLKKHDPTALQRWGLEREYGDRMAAIK